jgi:phage tail sheath protein FI
MLETAAIRKDCMAMLAPPIADGDSAATAITYATGLTSTSYAAVCSTNGQVYDKYNDQYVWIGLGGHMAGLCAGTDDVADPWFSPAGFTRGQIFGVTKLAYAPNQAQRDDLYKARVNPIVAFPGEGTVLYGDKTLEAKPNAFDRINVRRLFIVLRRQLLQLLNINSLSLTMSLLVLCLRT